MVKTPKKKIIDSSQQTLSQWLSPTEVSTKEENKISSGKRKKQTLTLNTTERVLRTSSARGVSSKQPKAEKSSSKWLSKTSPLKEQSVDKKANEKQTKAKSAKPSLSTSSKSKTKLKLEYEDTNSNSTKTKDKKPLKISTKKVENSTKDSKGLYSYRKTSHNDTAETISNVNSVSSEDLPTFQVKQPRKRLKQTDTFKKYGVIIPSVDEIMADQEHLTNYKNQVEEAQTLKEPSFKMCTSPETNVIEEIELRDCKHLNLEDITRHFKDNISFLTDIFKGKKYSDRHRRYYDKKNLLQTLTNKDLTYNTSTIVFTFEQLDHIVSLMQEHFDPDDKNTCYFFKVLVPELCLKIFMDTYKMNKREANRYLDIRPIQ